MKKLDSITAAVIIVALLGLLLVAFYMNKEPTHKKLPVPGAVVMDSLHEKDCYHGYILLPNGNQLVDATGHTVPCSN